MNPARQTFRGHARALGLRAAGVCGVAASRGV